MRYKTTFPGIILLFGLVLFISSCGHEFDEPFVESISPQAGQPGSPVVILGEHLSDSNSQTKVIIAGEEVDSREIFDIEEDRIRFRIPTNVFTGDLRVKVGDKKSDPLFFDVIGSWLYVLHQGARMVTPVETHGHGVEQTFELPAVPTNIVFSYDGRYAYAIHKDDDMITVVRSYDNTVITSIPVESEPHAGANIANLDNPYVFILHEGSPSVTVINTERNEVETVIPLGCPPTAIAGASDGDLACVVCREERMLYLIDPEDLEVTDEVSLEFKPGKIEMGPDDNTIVILNDEENALTVVNLLDIDDQDTMTFVSQPVDFAVSQSEERACVIHTDNTASIVRLSGPDLLQILEVGTDPVAVVVEPYQRYAFVANRQSSDLSVIDLSDRTNILTIALEAPPVALATAESPVGNWLYIANKEAPWLSVVSLGQYDVDDDEEPDPDLFGFLFSLDTNPNPFLMETQQINRKLASEEGYPESGIS